MSLWIVALFALSNLGAFYIGLSWNKGPERRRSAVMIVGMVALVVVLLMALLPGSLFR
jgi:hypothetical protein